MVALLFISFTTAEQAKGQTILNLTLTTNVNPIREQYALNMQQSWSNIGVNLTVEILEWGAFVGSVLAVPPTYQLGIIGFSFGLDPDLSTFYHSTGGLNLFGPWNDSYNDDLLVWQQPIQQKEKSSMMNGKNI